MLQIAEESLAAFDDSELRRVFREPWEVVKRLPRLRRQMTRRMSHLVAVGTTRLTAQQKLALQQLAKKHRTTMSALQRRTIEELIARETDLR